MSENADSEGPPGVCTKSKQGHAAPLLSNSALRAPIVFQSCPSRTHCLSSLPFKKPIAF